MHRLTLAFATLALLLVACGSTESDAGVALAATPVATPPPAPSVEPTPSTPPPTQMAESTVETTH